MKGSNILFASCHATLLSVAGSTGKQPLLVEILVDSVYRSTSIRSVFELWKHYEFDLAFVAGEVVA